MNKKSENTWLNFLLGILILVVISGVIAIVLFGIYATWTQESLFERIGLLGLIGVIFFSLNHSIWL